MEPGQISELSLSDDVAFRVDFDGPPPPSRERYWRGPVLSRFDGRRWTSGSPQYGGIPASRGKAPITYTVTLEPSYRAWLFALDLPSALPKPENDADRGEPGSTIAFLTRDQQLLSRSPLTQPLRYVQQSVLSYIVSGLAFRRRGQPGVAGSQPAHAAARHGTARARIPTTCS